jgi:multidrug efflux pump subunit AcrA (membrane-fusion protein)
LNSHPKLRLDLVLVEQTYRGEQSFIVKDPEARKYYRFGPAEVRVMRALDGEHTAAEAAVALQQQGLRVSAATVDKFAAKLAGMGLCERTLEERSVLLMERLRAERRRRLSKGIFQGDLLRLRWSVGDPDKLLDRWLPHLRFLFSRTFIVISVLLFAIYFVVIALKWGELSKALADLYTLRIGAGDLAVLWLTGTVIIVFHELGHGFTCKYFGGHVHEIGAMLIYFEPAFFCNVNDAWTFPELRARLWVTAAGSWIQFVIAGIAAAVWWAAAPGTIVSEIAFAAVLIGGVTTVFMNLNPLIPLDGYYALSDYLEVPNLRQRASGHISWLIRTRIFRLDVPEPRADEREKRIFLIYGGLAAIYIALILAFCAINSYGWLSRTFGAVGVLVFTVGVWMMLRRQLRGWGQTMWMAVQKQAAALRSNRFRWGLLATSAALILVGTLTPWPITISGPFTVSPSAIGVLTAPDSGIVSQVHVQEGTRVPAGALVLRVRNRELERQAISVRRLTDSLAVVASKAMAAERVSEVAQIQAVRSVEASRLGGLEAQLRTFAVRALSPGVVLTPRPQELTGQWVYRGQVLLRMGRPDTVEVRIALSGAGASWVQVGQSVRLLPEAGLGTALSSKVAEVSPSARSSHSLEGRVRIPGSDSWRPGMTGQASITLRRSNLWGALWWSVRRGIRTDILL